ncbi:MAG TPA: hypothetical protein VGE21_16655, partial [Flavobacteriales bacterium]
MTSIKLFATAALFCGSLLAFGQNCTSKIGDAAKPMSAKDKTTMLAKELSFTAEQTKQVELILQRTEESVKAMHGKEDAAAMVELDQKENKALVALLDEKQLAKYEELRKSGKAGCCAGGAKSEAGAKPACCAGG